jgi:class 3 adenylate cyclase
MQLEAPTGADQEALRSLRFAGDLEAEFRDDHHLGALESVRYLAGVLCALSIAVLIREWEAPEFGRQAPVIWFSRLLAFGAMCAATFHRDFFRRHAQTVVAGLLLAIQATAVAAGVAVHDPVFQDPVLYFKLIAFNCVEVVAYYTMFRLRLVPATVVAWTTMISSIASHLLVLRLPPAQVGFAGLLLINANLVGVFAAWFAERSARRDFLLRRLLDRERARSEDLLCSILPGAVAERLKAGAGTIADSFAEVTVLFADIVGFTEMAARRRPEEVVEMLNEVFTEFDRLAERHGLEKIKTIGDAYMVVGGLPEPRADHAQAVARLALDMRESLTHLSRRHGEPLRMRFGMNSGPVVAGVIGKRRFLYDLWGDTVNLASRMEAHGEADTILVTPETAERLGSQFRLEALPPVHVKGRGEVTPFRLAGPRPASDSQ